MKTIRVAVGLLTIGFALAACQDDAPAPANVAAVNPPKLAKADVAKGEGLYRARCASCHGARGEGAPDWNVPGPNGKYPPPPLDGSGKAWHHPSVVLREIILNGSVGGKGAMPPSKDLSEQDVDALIIWMQSLWPVDVYNAWLEVDEGAKP